MVEIDGIRLMNKAAEKLFGASFVAHRTPFGDLLIKKGVPPEPGESKKPVFTYEYPR